MMESKKRTYTGWKDERGLLLYDGDAVTVRRIGATCWARVRFDGTFGRWMMRVTNIQREDGLYYPVTTPVHQDITLCGARFTRRVRGVWKIMNRPKEEAYD